MRDVPVPCVREHAYGIERDAYEMHVVGADLSVLRVNLQSISIMIIVNVVS